MIDVIGAAASAATTSTGYGTLHLIHRRNGDIAAGVLTPHGVIELADGDALTVYRPAPRGTRCAALPACFAAIQPAGHRPAPRGTRCAERVVIASGVLCVRREHGRLTPFLVRDPRRPDPAAGDIAPLFWDDFAGGIVGMAGCECIAELKDPVRGGSDELLAGRPFEQQPYDAQVDPTIDDERFRTEML